MTVDLRLLAARASRGERAAFAAIVEETKDGLFRLAARITGSAADGEDALQEAYVKAHEAIEDGRFDGRADPRTWLHRIVVNAAVDCLRARRRRREDPEPAEPSRGPAGDAALALSELGAWLSDLPDEQRTVVVLRAIEGRTAREAAQILGATEEAVEQRLVRARSALRRRRDGDDGR